MLFKGYVCKQQSSNEFALYSVEEIDRDHINNFFNNPRAYLDKVKNLQRSRIQEGHQPFIFKIDVEDPHHAHYLITAREVSPQSVMEQCGKELIQEHDGNESMKERIQLCLVKWNQCDLRTVNDQHKVISEHNSRLDTQLTIIVPIMIILAAVGYFLNQF